MSKKKEEVPTTLLAAGTTFNFGGIVVALVEDTPVTFDGCGNEQLLVGMLVNEGDLDINRKLLKGEYDGLGVTIVSAEDAEEAEQADAEVTAPNDEDSDEDEEPKGESEEESTPPLTVVPPKDDDTDDDGKSEDPGPEESENSESDEDAETDSTEDDGDGDSTSDDAESESEADNGSDAEAIEARRKELDGMNKRKELEPFARSIGVDPDLNKAPLIEKILEKEFGAE